MILQKAIDILKPYETIMRNIIYTVIVVGAIVVIVTEYYRIKNENTKQH